MAYFAELDASNIVKRVIVADDLQWCVDNLGGTWIETFLDTPGKVYASPGWQYHSDVKSFAPPKPPYSSWTLDPATLQWVPPVPRPNPGRWQWDEANTTWTHVPTT